VACSKIIQKGGNMSTENATEYNDYLVKHFTMFASVLALKLIVIYACKNNIEEDPSEILITLLNNWKREVLLHDEKKYKDMTDDFLFRVLGNTIGDMKKSQQQAMDRLYPILKDAMLAGNDDLKKIF